MYKTQAFETDIDDDRLDKFLVRQCPTISRSRIQALISGGFVKVDGDNARQSLRLRRGQEVIIDVPPIFSEHPVPKPRPLEIIFEDQHLLVLNKPAGLIVQPTPSNPTDTLVNALLANYTGLERVGGVGRSGVVHRLDKETSGLLVVAKNELTYSSLRDQFKSRQVSKVYQALVKGDVSPLEADIDAPIGRHPRDPKRMAVVSTGRDSITRYTVINRFKGCTLVQLKPTTGRTHQIRVHMASIGNPVIGDTVYGNNNPKLNRHFLHATVLGFKHPSSSEFMEFKSELPHELVDFIKTLTLILPY